MDTTNYGSIITEQGDLGFGVTPINEQDLPNSKEEKEKNEK